MSELEAHTPNELRRLDRVARERAQSVFDRPVALEAGAGTGKTTALVARVVAWCMSEGWERAVGFLGSETDSAVPAEVVAERVLSRVVAITFTEAAAAEMESRVGQALVEAELGGIPRGLHPGRLPGSTEERRRRARALLGALDHLLVRTIHAFCRRLLAAYPLESGLDPGFQVDADGSALEATVLEVLEARLVDAYGEAMEPNYLVLGREGIGPREIGEALLALASEGVPAAALAADPFAPRAVAATVAEVRERAAALSRLEGGRFERVRGRAGVTADTALLVGQLSRRLAKVDAEAVDPAWLADLARSFQQAVGGRLAAWGRGRFNKAEAAALGPDGAEFRERSLRLRELVRVLAELNPALLGSARQVLQPLLERVYQLLRSRGVQTFASLLVDARDLLARDDDVRRRVVSGIDQLLVDEFQDTDAVQCDLVRLIAFGADTRPGLFLVGDPKQSIYGWRNADLAAYDAFLAVVAEHGGELHRLSVNFRSVPAVLAEVDRVVEPVMQREVGLQPAYEPLVASPDRALCGGFMAGGAAPVEHWVAWRIDGATPAPKTLALDAARIEARALAADMAELHRAHGVAWRGFGVLFRSTGDLEIYLRALRDEGVPYEVVRDRSYYQRREIIEAAAVVRAVLDPNDHLALMTALRSVLVGLPDAALIPLWGRELPRLFTELRGPRGREIEEITKIAWAVAKDLPSGVPGLERVAGWEQNLIAFALTVAHLRVSFEADAPDVFIELLRRLTLIEETAAARYLGDYRVANLDRFFRELLETLETGGDAQGALRVLRRGVGEARDAEEARPRDTAQDAVRVLTIHQAKGLDFDHVYVAQLHKGRPLREAITTQAERVGEGWEYLLFGSPSLRFDRVRSRRQLVEAAERVRTLYVALTRARDRVVLMGNWPTTAGAPRAVRDAGSYMDLLQWRAGEAPALATRLGELTGSGLDGGLPTLDEANARWRFPGLLSDADPSRARQVRERPTLPAQRQVARAARDLAARQGAAATRMSRPLGSVASAEASLVDCERQAARFTVDSDQGSGHTGDVRDVAQAAGTAIHRVLETFDLEAEPAAEFERQAARLEWYLRPLVRDDRVAAALERARGLLDRLARGRALVRLRSLRARIVARELPVLLPPSTVGGAVDYVVGAIDLVYRDERSGDYVVVDYKTDAIEDPARIAERAAGYAQQGKLYTAALREALGLTQTPRFELWFLYPDQIVGGE